MKRLLILVCLALVAVGFTQVPSVAGESSCGIATFDYGSSAVGASTKEAALAETLAVRADLEGVTSTVLADEVLKDKASVVEFQQAADGSYLVERFVRCEGPDATAAAHAWTAMFDWGAGNTYWEVEHETAQPIWCTTNEIGGGAKESDLEWADNAWNQLGSLTVVHDESCDGEGDFNFNNFNCSDLVIGENKIHLQEVSGNPWAATFACTGGGFIKTFTMAFDVDPNWNTGSGSPGSNQVDFRGVARHEFGHAAGYSKHWDGVTSSLCHSNPPQSSDQTMCAFMNEGQQHWRTLETHDEHTFQNRY